MSFVGPRPVLPGIPYAEYDDVRRKRLTVRPGITAVSYTHLDVYKRQSVTRSPIFFVQMISHRPAIFRAAFIPSIE